VTLLFSGSEVRAPLARDQFREVKRLAFLLLALPLTAHAGGSNYGIAPGARPDLAGKVERVAGADATLCARSGRRSRRQHLHRGDEWHKVARFDPRRRASRSGTCRRGIIRTDCWWDRQGSCGRPDGNGTIGKLDPASGR